MKVVVFGAGAFGGWSALFLRRLGYSVTLIDAWGPGNSRASSGGETRVIRYMYDREHHMDLVHRAFTLWHEHEKRCNQAFFRKCGFLWMTHGEDTYEKTAVMMLGNRGIPFEELSPAQIKKRFPSIDTRGVSWAIYEPGAGFLFARRACQAVVDAFIEEGGTYRIGSALPPLIEHGDLQSVQLSDGTDIKADAYVFACGPWLGRLFADSLKNILKVTRQEVFYFGLPPGETALSDESFPVWADNNERFWYGIPGNEHRGFKIADDTPGPEFDPSTTNRLPDPETVDRARRYLEMRFPLLKAAPLVEARVCQYTYTPDHDFIMDRHPEAENVWIVGGGCGHGFKHGPAIGELVANGVSGKQNFPTHYRLERFSGMSRDREGWSP